MAKRKKAAKRRAPKRKTAAKGRRKRKKILGLI